MVYVLLYIELMQFILLVLRNQNKASLVYPKVILPQMRPLRYISYLFVLFVISMLSCEDAVIDQGFKLGREYSFEINKLYTSEDGHYSLIINKVSDSRCPDCAICIWSGEVTIKGEWVIYGKNSMFEVHSVVSKENIQPDDHTIQIVDVKPYPKCESPQIPEDIIVTLLINK